MGYGKHVEDKDRWFGSFNSTRGLGKQPKRWIQEKYLEKKGKIEWRIDTMYLTDLIVNPKIYSVI